MASYYNVDGEEVKIETPFWVNILPIATASIGAYYAYKNGKSNKAIALFGLIAGAVGFLPRLMMVNKGVKDTKEMYAKKPSEVVHEGTVEHVVSSNDILAVIEKLADKNKNLDNFLPKKDYFHGIIDKFNQREKDAAFEIVTLVGSLPDNPKSEDIADMMERMDGLKDKYGNDFLNELNSKLNEISGEINAKKESEEKSKSVAA
jgi:hypothetical protein